MQLDYSLYPDLDESEWPAEPLTLEEQADYIHRLCSSWDFYGFVPDVLTLRGLSAWHKALVNFPILQSPAYCGLCDLLKVPHGAPEPYLGRLPWEEADELEGRELDQTMV